MFIGDILKNRKIDTSRHRRESIINQFIEEILKGRMGTKWYPKTDKTMKEFRRSIALKINNHPSLKGNQELYEFLSTCKQAKSFSAMFYYFTKQEITMKKLIILLALLVPVFSFAASDSVTINPIVPVCGEQDIEVTFNSSYGANNRHLVTYLDDVQIDHYNNEPSSVTETIHVGPGSHQVKARIYLIEWDATHFSIQLASKSKSFTVIECDEPDDEEQPPVDEEPTDEEEPNDEETPTDNSTSTEGSRGTVSGTTINSRLCFLSGRTVCIPYGVQTKEMIPLMIQLADLFYQRNQLSN